MDEHKEAYYKAELFGQIFALNNALQQYLDGFLKEEGLTVKQMYTLLAVDHFKEEKPTLKDVATLLKSSHQNVKQLVNKLKENGYVSIEKDEQDKRALSISLTTKANIYFSKHSLIHSNIINTLFKGVHSYELQAMLEGMMKLMSNIEQSEEIL